MKTKDLGECDLDARWTPERTLRRFGLRRTPHEPKHSDSRQPKAKLKNRSLQPKERTLENHFLTTTVERYCLDQVRAELPTIHSGVQAACHHYRRGSL